MVAARPPPPLGPAAPAGRRAIARIVDFVLAWIPAFVVMVLGPDDRPVAVMFLGWVAIVVYEVMFLTLLGATPGKLLTGLRVLELEGSKRVSLRAALARSVELALVSLTLVFVPAMIGSVLMSPLRRGFHDRHGHTFVTRRDGPERVTQADLVQFEQLFQPPPNTRFGPAANLDTRRRARAHRLERAPWLLAGLVLVVAVLQFGQSGLLLAGLSALWLVVFIVDESLRVARSGTTPGHEIAGMRIVDTRTGAIPSRGRSVARAAVLAPMLYIPPFQAVLAFWVTVHPTHRGPHDLAGATQVIRVDAVTPGPAVAVPAAAQRRLPPPPTALSRRSTG